MTKIFKYEHKSEACSLLATVASVIIMLLFSDTVSRSIKQGIKISALSVIPSVFPFLILADYFSSNINISMKNSITQRIFHLQSGCDGAMLCGLICGFPCGIKYALSLYHEKHIDKSELERIIGLINNPSLAFVVSGVGMGMLNSLSDGVILYLSLIISIFIISRLSVNANKKTKNMADIPRQSFSFSSSIKNAGYSSLTISSFIIFFSAILGVVQELVTDAILYAMIASFFEIGNASTIITAQRINVFLKFILLGFCLGFSGFSVHLQAFELLPKDISKNKYFKCKILEGLLSGVIAGILKTLQSII